MSGAELRAGRRATLGGIARRPQNALPRGQQSVLSTGLSLVCEEHASEIEHCGEMKRCCFVRGVGRVA